MALILPGMIDAHVHLREPGATQKEDVLTGTLAALAGGVVGILDMPNNQPPITDEASLHAKESIFQEKAMCDYGLFLGFDGQHVDLLVELAPRVVGLKLYLDETFGDMTTAEPARLAEVFEAWPGPGPIAVHAESASIAVALRLAARFGQRLHICHVPHPDDLLAIEDARQRGARVTCEVTPHHLFLSAKDASRLGAYGQMKPPLLPEPLRALYWDRLALIDLIGSDHAPHARAEKESATPPPGVPGLETTLPLLLTAVEEGRLSLDQMIDLTYQAPLEIYRLVGPADTSVEVEVGSTYGLPNEGYQTRCGWSPFAGTQVRARIIKVGIRGRIVWDLGSPQVAPGYGRPLQRDDGLCGPNDGV